MECCSSAGGRFALFGYIKPNDPHVAAWPKKDAIMAETIQEKGSAKKVPEQLKEKTKQSTKIVWTIGSPVWEGDTWEQPKYLTDSGKHFTEVCAMCKKNIDASQDVFMYSHMQAFCSEDCREDRIAFDKVFGPPSPRSKGTAANSKSVVRPMVDGTKAQALNRTKRLYTLGE